MLISIDKMPRLQSKSYHQIVAQNFLRNISLDGTHDDTALRIFKERGLHFNIRRDLPISIVIQPSRSSEIEKPASPDVQNLTEDAEIFATPVPMDFENHERRRLDYYYKTSLDSAEKPSGLKLGKGFSLDVTQPKQRRKKKGSFRERLGSSDFDPAKSRHGRRNFRESLGEGGLLEKLKAPFSQYHRRQESTKHVIHPSISVEQAVAGRSVKWGALPALGSMESVATRTSILSIKGGEVVVVDGDFTDTRAKRARICICRQRLPVMICSILSPKRAIGPLHRRLEPAIDTKSITSSEDGGLKPFALKGEEVSYSPMLVPSRSDNSIMQQSMSSESMSYFAASRPSSTSSAFGTIDQQSPDDSSNLLAIDTGGQSVSQKHDVSIDSDLTVNRSSLIDFRQLDDPEFGAGKHKTILTFTGYMTSLIDYVNRDEMKREINEKFRKKFPEIRLTYSKYQSLKRDMKAVASGVNLDLLTLAQAYCYFDTIVLKALISKTNRKLVSSSCLLLAAKMNDVKGADLKALILKLEEVFRLNRKEFIEYELPVVVALEFRLHVPVGELSAQYQKLLWST